MYIPWIFGIVGFFYALPIVGGIGYWGQKYLHLWVMDWKVVIAVSLVPALIMAIYVFDW